MTKYVLLSAGILLVVFCLILRGLRREARNLEAMRRKNEENEPYDG